MHVRFQDTAEQDLDAIKEYLATRSPQGLERILTAIFTVADQLETFPFLGHDGDINGTRELTVPRTPFRLVYTLDDPHFVDIIRVIHGRMKYPPEDD
jgi:toxin ParE1/3/4